MDPQSGFFRREAASFQTRSRLGTSVQANARVDSAGEANLPVAQEWFCCCFLGVLNARGKGARSHGGFAGLFTFARDEL